MDEAALLEKFRKVEALFAAATTVGERQAAQAASDRITARLRQLTDGPTRVLDTPAPAGS